MKKAIGFLGLGLVLGVMAVPSFANEKEAIQTEGYSTQPSQSREFEVMNYETNRFEKMDDSSEYNGNDNRQRGNYGNGYNCCNYNNGNYNNNF